jgi:hypothetical protein
LHLASGQTALDNYGSASARDGGSFTSCDVNDSTRTSSAIATEHLEVTTGGTRATLHVHSAAFAGHFI